MKTLVLLGEGHGEVTGLPVLARKLLDGKNVDDQIRLDYQVIRAHNPSGLVKWDKKFSRPDFSQWHKYLNYAARRKDIGGVLAVFDGDANTFPAGSKNKFCAATAAKLMAQAAKDTGAGKNYSLAVVFACVEYETWLVAGTGSPGLFHGNPEFPPGDRESHGKKWVEDHTPSYRPSRDQKRLTELLDLQIVRGRGLRSFTRLDHAIDQLVAAMTLGSHISSPS